MPNENEAQLQTYSTSDLIQECQRLNDELTGLIFCYNYHDEIISTEAILLVDQINSLLQNNFGSMVQSSTDEPIKGESEIEPFYTKGKLFKYIPYSSFC